MQKQTIPTSVSKNFYQRKSVTDMSLITYTLIIVVIYIAGFIGVSGIVEQIKKEYRVNLSNSLHTVLNTTNTGLQLWVNEQISIAQSVAAEKQLLVLTSDLLRLQPKRDTLLSSEILKKIRGRFLSLFQYSDYQGFFIIGPGNINLASSRDQNISEINLLYKQPDILKKLWRGEPVISQVLFSDVPLSAGDHNNKTMFVGAPLKDNSGRVIALLTLRINPLKTLFPLLEQGRIGQSGETYAIDKNGLLLSRSRFNKDAVQAGLIKKDEDGALIIKILDPGNDISKGAEAIIPREQQSLTLMATNVIQYGEGSNLDGYRDYRGIPVIGAWVWNKELDIGLTVEQDVAEAYALFRLTAKLIYTAAAIIALSLILLAIVFFISRHRLREISIRLEAIFDTTADGIVVIDSKGIIESVNPAIEKIFGYSSDYLKNKNVNILMTASDQSEHDNHLSRYLNTGQARIIGMGRQLEGRRKNGEIFPLELNVSQVKLGAKIFFAGTIRDISLRVNAEKKLQIEKRALKNANTALSLTHAALERTQIAELWLDDDDGRVLTASDYACQHFGCTYEEIMQLSVPDFDPLFSLEKFREIVREIRISGWARFESVHQTMQGQRKPVEITALYHNRDNDQQGMVITFIVDITQRKEREMEIILAREAAETANQAKSEFLATMSHEIRTPLNGIVATLDMLSLTRMDEVQKDMVNTAQNSSDTLIRVIDDILDFSKIEAGHLNLQPEPTCIEEIIEDVAQSICLNATKRGVTLLIYCEPELPTVVGDPVRLRQVVYNLAGNAIKFSSGDGSYTGRVFVSVACLPEESSATKISFCLRVKDNGIGMSTEVQERLFKPFSQGESTTTRRFGGTGLGLVICRRLVDMMGGEIDLESEEGIGTEFRVKLTLDKVVAPKEPESYQFTGVKALLTGEDDEVVMFLADYLRHAKVTVETCRVDEVLAHITLLNPLAGEDVVLIDCRDEDEPVKNLFDSLFTMISDQINLCSLQIYSGQHPQRIQSQNLLNQTNTMALNVNALKRSTFLSAIADLTGRSVSLPTQETRFVSEQGQEDVSLKQDQLILLVDDNSTNRKVICQQLKHLGYPAETAKNGREALEKWRNRRYTLVLTDCHMPEMDGYELAQMIRREEDCTGRTPVIAITADALKGTEKLCRDAGMDDYITKPVQLNYLDALLTKWLVNRPAIETPGKSTGLISSVNTNNGAENEDVIDPKAMKLLLGIEDEALLMDYYHDFVASSTPAVNELIEAFKLSDMTKVYDISHKVKSSARTIGANKLADCCAMLEKLALSGGNEILEKLKDELLRTFNEVLVWIENYNH